MSKIQNILVTGGLGFVGSNTIIDLYQQSKSKIIIIDDLSNCYRDVLDRIIQILAQKYNPQDVLKRITFKQGNILDLKFLQAVFQTQKDNGTPIDAIMHFAAKKAVGQSVLKPLQYYQNNLVGSLNLFKMMEKYTQCTNFIFSSTASVYGDTDNCKETDPNNPTQPYAQSKVCVQMLMKSLSKVHKNWKFISLRYFNPVGAHQSGLIGDDPSVFPANLVPYIQEVIIGKRPKLVIFGKDYNTLDGTCVRDFIHIQDLARAHVLAFEKIQKLQPGVQIYNMGTGRGASVLEVVQAFEKALGHPINYQFGQRRVGDLPRLVANADKASKQLNWKPQRTIEDICKDCCHFLSRRYNYKPKSSNQ